MGESTGVGEPSSSGFVGEPSGSSTAVSGQATGSVPLAPEAPKAVVGEVVQDGLVYQIEGEVAALVGWRGSAPAGDVSVPARVTSGADSYAVVRIGVPDADGKSVGVLADSSAESLSLPESIETIVDGALAGCPSLERVLVSSKNPHLASYDGMLFMKDLTSLLSIPEGKGGVARIPDQASAVPASALSQCAKLSCILVGEGSTTFASRNGVLYSLDMKTLIACPPGAGEAVVVPEEVEAIAAGAFAGCSVASIAALGNVREIAEGAFDDAAKSAVVALPAGEDYDARKAVWEAAGFSEFAEPAKPGDETTPGAPEGEDAEGEPGVEASGLAYTLLDDYTLSVAWMGSEDPAADLEIPATAELNGVSYRVSAVAQSAFEGRASLRSVKLPASVTAIGDAAFANCSNLVSVQLPEGLRSIGARAFESTTLADLWLPASLVSVGSRALAACGSLSRVVALGAPDVASDALAECLGVTVYCLAASAASWNVGLPAAGNHLAPYGVTLAEMPLDLEVGQAASLFEPDDLLAPDGVQTSFAYSAKPISVDQDGLVSAKAEGTSEVSVALTLDNKELVRATRTVEVALAPQVEADAPTDSASPDTSAPDDPSAAQPVPATDAISQNASLASLAPTGSAALGVDILSETVTLATGDSFEKQVSSGHTLKFTVLEEDEQAKTGKVAVSKSDNAALLPAGALVIPATVQGDNGVAYQVTELAENAFQKAFFLEAVTFEEGCAVTSVGAQSFGNCRSLTFISLPDTVETIGAGAFNYCVSLTDVDLSSVRSIGDECFMLCSLLSSVTLGKDLTSLPRAAFSNCVELKTVYANGVVQSFGYESFGYLPTESVTVYAADAQAAQAWEATAAGAGYTFGSVQVRGELCSVTFDAQGGSPASYVQTATKGQPIAEPKPPYKEGFSLSGWFTAEGARWNFGAPVQGDLTLYAQWVAEATDGVLTYRMRSDGQSLSVAAVDPASLTGSIEIPSEFSIGGTRYPIAEIAPYAFHNSNISSVSIPASVMRIGNQAFEKCASMTSVVFGQNSQLRVIETSAFSGCRALAAIELPEGVEDIRAGAFHTNVSLESIALPAAVTIIPTDLFFECRKLKNVQIHGVITGIGSHAFQNCLELEFLELSAAVSEVGDYAFSSCRMLKGIDLSVVTSIGSYAFNDCRAMGPIDLPNVRTVGDWAFNFCRSLSSVSMPRVETIGESAFKECATFDKIALPASLKTVGAEAFFNCRYGAGIYAEGSMADAGIPAAFNTNGKASMKVLLPTVSTDGNNTPFEEMKAAWVGYGFQGANVLLREGALPLASDPEGTPNADPTKAGWSLDVDGTLRIEGTETIANFGWVYNGTAQNEEHWGPVRAAVTRIEMSDSLPGVDGSMASWFQKMPNLRDISGVRVLPGTKDASNLFLSDASLTEVPSGWVLPAEVETVEGLFSGCTSLERVAESFTLPGSSAAGPGVTNANYLFYKNESLREFSFLFPDSVTTAKSAFSECKSLVTLPEGFSIPDALEDVSNLFSVCTALRKLPASFVPSDQSALKNVNYMLGFCSSLESLPEGFKIPAGVTSMEGTFTSCPSLVILPDSFDFPASAEGIRSNLFNAGTPSFMYYAGNKPAVLDFDWPSSNRTLVTPTNKPDEAEYVEFHLMDEGEVPGDLLWSVRFTGAQGILAEPDVVPARTGRVFTLWYADEACTKRMDFSRPIAEQAQQVNGRYVVYGEYVSGLDGDTLPTEAGTGSAFWSLADDGALYIRGGGTIDTLNWEEGTAVSYETHWGPHRSFVTRVSMSPSVNAANMTYWFADMVNLVDVEQVELSASTNYRRAFQGCTSLEVLPDSFSLPADTIDVSSMFQECSNLRSLPAGFAIPEGTQYVQDLFKDCLMLSSLPEGFAIPSSVQDMSRMLAGCTSLASLPDGFAVAPEALAKASEPFYRDLLTDGSRVPTYYAGNDQAVLSYDWESQNRTLVASEGDMGDFGMQRAVFKVQSADGAAGYPWETFYTAWSDKQGILANPGEPQLEGYTFSGWCVDEDCLQPFDFSEPLTDRTELYGRWLVAGGFDASLPLAAGSPADAYAWWRITAEGKLELSGNGKVGDLGLRWEASTEKPVYWAPYRDRVKSVSMDARLGATSMAAWFCRMPNLVDASGAFVPEGTRNVSDLFYGCSKLAEVPEGFVLSDSVVMLGSMFHGCVSLRQLPQGFTVPKNVSSASNMFRDCASLEALPEGFSVPTGLTEGGMSRMFSGCNKLTVLPKSFDFSLAIANASDSPFKCAAMTDTYYTGSSAAVAGYDWASQNRRIVSAAPAGKVLVECNLPAEGQAFEGQALWTSVLVDAGAAFAAPVAPVRAGWAFEAWYADAACETPYDFAKTPVENGVAEGGTLRLYAKYLAKRGQLPTTDGAENATWELSDDGTLRIWCEAGAIIRSLDWGSSETEDYSKHTTEQWGPMRSLVKRIVVDASMKAESMAAWFCNMPALKDVSSVRVPDGVRSVESLFSGCSAISSLSSEFALPNTVTNAYNCFERCSSLVSLPVGFTMPDSIDFASGMFSGCSSLSTLPDSFTLSDNLKRARYMMSGMGLTHLPDGFSLPENIEDIDRMFKGTPLESLPSEFTLPTGAALTADCAFELTKLRFLPQGFTVPANVTTVAGMFRSTPLEALPEGFAIEGAQTRAAYTFANCPELALVPKSLSIAGLNDANKYSMFGWEADKPGYVEGPVATYYAGDAVDLGGSEYWLTKYNRELRSLAGELPTHVFKATFKLQKPGGEEASDWMTVLTTKGEDGSARVSEPPVPSLFGYVFSGWTDAVTGQPFDFSQPISSDVVLTGGYTLVLDVDVPLASKVEIDAAGNVEAAAFDVVSRTPVAVSFSQVTSAAAPGASKLVPRAEDLAKVTLDLKMGEGASTPVSVVGGAAGPFETLAAAAPGAPSTLTGFIDMKLNGAQVDYQPGEDITSLAKLTWTVEAAS